MSKREDIPLSVEWLRRLRDERYVRNRNRNPEDVWKEDHEAAERAARTLGLKLTKGRTRTQRRRTSGGTATAESGSEETES